MAHIVTERCVKCRYTDCCTVCPVDCFYEVADPAMLVIDPNVCIDCALCVPACPIAAIWPEDELPDVYSAWTEKNADLFEGGTKIKIKKDPLPGALTLAALQAREKQRGWQVTEPSGAGEGGEGAAAEGEPAATTAEVSADAVLGALTTSRFKWRTARGIGRELGVTAEVVQAQIDSLVAEGKVRRAPATNVKAPAVFGPVAAA